MEKAAENGFNCTMCRTFKTTKGLGTVLLRLKPWTVLFLFVAVSILICFSPFVATVMTKARDVIDPQVMTQIFTKAKEMGKLTALKKIDHFSQQTEF